MTASGKSVDSLAHQCFHGLCMRCYILLTYIERSAFFVVGQLDNCLCCSIRSVTAAHVCVCVVCVLLVTVRYSYTVLASRMMHHCAIITAILSVVIVFHDQLSMSVLKRFSVGDR